MLGTPFQGNDAQLTRSANGFWHDFGQTIGTIARDTDGRLAVQERRLIRFHDTADHCLRRDDYVFRERIDEATGQREITLKFSHPDRYLAASRDHRRGHWALLALGPAGCEYRRWR